MPTLTDRRVDRGKLPASGQAFIEVARYVCVWGTTTNAAQQQRLSEAGSTAPLYPYVRPKHRQACPQFHPQEIALQQDGTGFPP
jgi:hypothetical protein